MQSKLSFEAMQNMIKYDESYIVERNNAVIYRNDAVKKMKILGVKKLALIKCLVCFTKCNIIKHNVEKEKEVLLDVPPTYNIFQNYQNDDIQRGI